MARLRLTKIGGDSAPPSGQVSVYAKTDDNLYLQTDAGNEYQLLNSGTPGVGGYQVEQHEIDPGQLAAKQIVLLDVPTHPSRTLVFIDGAGATFQGLDFEVSGNTVSWSGKRLDGLLDLNDRIQIVYF